MNWWHRFWEIINSPIFQTIAVMVLPPLGAYLLIRSRRLRDWFFHKDHPARIAASSAFMTSCVVFGGLQLLGWNTSRQLAWQPVAPDLPTAHSYFDPACMYRVLLGDPISKNPAVEATVTHIYHGPKRGSMIYFYEVNPDSLVATLGPPTDDKGDPVHPNPVSVFVAYDGKQQLNFRGSADTTIEVPALEQLCAPKERP